MGEGLALGLGLGEAVLGDRLTLGRLVAVGDGLARCAGVCCTWLGVGEVGAGESAPPDPVVVDAGATSR